MTSPNISIPLMVLSRICTVAIFMTYPACLRVLLSEWEMTATEGGIVQGAFTVAFAVSLLVASRLSDRIGPARVFNGSAALAAITALLFAAFARSYESAIPLSVLLGLSQGGTYTPAIMLVSGHAAPGRKATAVGWILAGMSAGYVVSIVLSNAMVAAADYRAAFWATGSLPVLGWGLGRVATRHIPPSSRPAAYAGNWDTPMADPHRARILIVAYIGHSWELLGAWAWMPAFLGLSLLAGEGMTNIEIGIWIALVLHASGFFSSFISGMAADRFGVNRTLLFFGMLGAIVSLGIGWLGTAGPVLLLGAAALYGFATIGDSAVLSSAMTDAVAPERLGRMLGLRSVLGIGAGALSPVVFGAVLDAQPGAPAWGLAFGMLAIGGLTASVCASLLLRAGSNGPTR